MPRNGSGIYSLPAGNPVVTGTTISSTWANSTLADIQTALTGSLAADGQTIPSGNLPMGGYRLTNLGDAVAAADATNLGQVQAQIASLAASVFVSSNTGGAATYDFDLPTSTYDEFMLLLDNLIPSVADSALWLRFGTSNTYATSGYAWSSRQQTATPGGGDAGSTSDAKIVLLSSVDAAAGAAAHGSILVRCGSSPRSRMEARLSCFNSSVFYGGTVFGALAATAHTQVRLMFSSGNIASGTARLYAWRKS